MENALREAGVEPTVIRSDDDLQGAVPLTHSRCFLVKLHGDYLDSRIKNTNEELGAYSAPMNALLDRVLDEHGIIACGWSGDWDHALRAAIQRAPSRRYPFYWASRGPLSHQARTCSGIDAERCCRSRKPTPSSMAFGGGSRHWRQRSARTYRARTCLSPRPSNTWRAQSTEFG